MGSKLSKALYILVVYYYAFLVQISTDYIFVRGKYQMMDIINAKNLQYVKTIETQGHGVFSAWADTVN